MESGEVLSLVHAYLFLLLLEKCLAPSCHKNYNTYRIRVFKRGTDYVNSLTIELGVSDDCIIG